MSVLRTLATIGDGATPRTIARVAGVDVAAVFEELAALERAGLARPWAWQPTSYGRQEARDDRS